MSAHEVMIWTPDGGKHATTIGGLRDALGVDPIFLREYTERGYSPDDGDGLFAVDMEATAKAAGCDFGWLPFNGVWAGEAAMATPGAWLPPVVTRPEQIKRSA